MTDTGMLKYLKEGLELLKNAGSRGEEERTPMSDDFKEIVEDQKAVAKKLADKLDIAINGYDILSQERIDSLAEELHNVLWDSYAIFTGEEMNKRDELLYNLPYSRDDFER